MRGFAHIKALACAVRELKVSGAVLVLTMAAGAVGAGRSQVVGQQRNVLRGQFLSKYATNLLEDLRGTSITFEFSQDFFERAVKYVMPHTAVVNQTSGFSACVGGADISWMDH